MHLGYRTIPADSLFCSSRRCTCRSCALFLGRRRSRTRIPIRIHRFIRSLSWLPKESTFINRCVSSSSHPWPRSTFCFDVDCPHLEWSYFRSCKHPIWLNTPRIRSEKKRRMMEKRKGMSSPKWCIHHLRQSNTSVLDGQWMWMQSLCVRKVRNHWPDSSLQAIHASASASGAGVLDSEGHNGIRRGQQPFCEGTCILAFHLDSRMLCNWRLLFTRPSFVQTINHILCQRDRQMTQSRCYVGNWWRG